MAAPDPYPTADRYIYRFLDTNGNGTGTKNAVGDYSVAAEEFHIQPPVSLRYSLYRMIVCIEDTAGMRAEYYGDLASALTNGIKVSVDDGAATELCDLTDGDPVKSNAGWGRHCFDVDVKTWGAGNELLLVRWTFSKAGAPVFLQEGHRLIVTLNDDLTGLVSHNFMVQGYVV